MKITERVIHPEDLPFLRKRRRITRTENDLKPYISYRVIAKSGQIKWIDQYSKIMFYQGKLAELVTIVDITEKKEAERLIIEEYKKLVSLDQIRKDFIIRASHELKTPLNSIYSAAEFLRDYYIGDIDAKVRKFIEIIYKGGKRLKVLIEDLLDVSRLETNNLQLKKQSTNLAKIIKSSVYELKHYLDLRYINLELNLPQDCNILMDKFRIEQVLANILSNAIKNTPPYGSILVDLIEDKNYVKLVIIDSGVGFTAEEKKIAFKKFGKIERYGMGMDIDTEGTGLGLFISKELVELHGGEIQLESKGRNKGSRFIITLPKL